jgi:hypothetical protein
MEITNDAVIECLEVESSVSLRVECRILTKRVVELGNDSGQGREQFIMESTYQHRDICNHHSVNLLHPVLR